MVGQAATLQVSSVSLLMSVELDLLLLKVVGYLVQSRRF